jgi:hypothetical protein
MISLKRHLVVAATVPLAILLTLLLNYSEAQQWKFSPGSGHIFMVNRLWQCGILEQYLDAQCATNPNSFCDHRPYPDQDLLWDPLSPINTVYGWEYDGWAKAQPEYDRIIQEIFTTPDYLVQFAGITFRDASKQLITFDFRPMNGPQNLGPAIPSVAAHYGNEGVSAKNTKQYENELDLNTLNLIQKITVAISVFALLFFLFIKKFRTKHPHLGHLTLWIFCGMIFNALTVVAVAMIDSRYQLRLVWLLPLVALLCLVQFVTEKTESRKSAA